MLRCSTLLFLLAGAPAPAAAIGLEASAGILAGLDGDGATQAGALLEGALAIDPQILVGLRLVGGARFQAGPHPLGRLGMSLHWRFDRARWVPRVAATLALAFGDLGEGRRFYEGALAGLEVAIDHFYCEPLSGPAYSIVLSLEQYLGSEIYLLTVGLRLRWAAG